VDADHSGGWLRSLAASLSRRAALGGGLIATVSGLYPRSGVVARNKKRKKKRADSTTPGPPGPPGAVGPPGPPGSGNCPSDTTFFGGAGCVENTIRAEVDFNTASTTCASAGRRLLTSAELEAYRQQPGVTIGDSASPGEWTGTFLDNNTALVINDSGGRFGVAMTLTFSFRCVTLPLI
jgi:hypothetical protein